MCCFCTYFDELCSICVVNACLLAQLTAKLTKLTGELEEERELNCCLRENQTTWQSRVAELEDGLAKKDIVSTSFY